MQAGTASRLLLIYGCLPAWSSRPPCQCLTPTSIKALHPRCLAEASLLSPFARHFALLAQPTLDAFSGEGNNDADDKEQQHQCPSKRAMRDRPGKPPRQRALDIEFLKPSPRKTASQAVEAQPKKRERPGHSDHASPGSASEPGICDEPTEQVVHALAYAAIRREAEASPLTDRDSGPRLRMRLLLSRRAQRLLSDTTRREHDPPGGCAYAAPILSVGCIAILAAVSFRFLGWALAPAQSFRARGSAVVFSLLIVNPHEARALGPPDCRSVR